jgi:hypothetical protein
MKTAKTMILAIFCALCMSAVVNATESDEVSTTAQQEPCCFTNPRFTGTCQVVPGPDESCGDILAYLNNPNSVGKSYCGNTKVRGGWSQASCEGSASTTTNECSANRE